MPFFGSSFTNSSTHSKIDSVDWLLVIGLVMSCYGYVFWSYFRLGRTPLLENALLILMIAGVAVLILYVVLKMKRRKNPAECPNCKALQPYRGLLKTNIDCPHCGFKE